MNDQRDIARRPVGGLLVEWPLVLSLITPAVLLCVLIAGVLIKQHAHTLRQQQAVHLIQQAQQIFADAENWASEETFRRALGPLAWQEATLRDHQGARFWRQARPQTDPAWPLPVELVIPLSNDTELVLLPAALPGDQLTHLRKLALYLGLLAIAAGLGIGLLSYGIAARRLHRALHWAQTLETGDLNAPSPVHAGLLGGIASSLEVIAQRLRFSRDALQSQNDHTARRNDDRIRQLQNEISALEADYRRIQKQLANRSEFTSSMSHELRTPLTAIMGFAELLGKDELTAEQNDYVQTIRKSAKSLINLISDLLDVERIEAGRLEIHETSFDPSNTVEDTLSLIAPLAYEKNLELISIVDHDIPALLRGDATRLQQILTNLISNAIKFTNEGQVLVRVSRQADQNATTRLRFEVEDTGLGISAAQQKKLFTAFQRFENPLQNRGNGSGLGLSIVKRLTELLGGEIEVRSAPGSGSSFSVTLPFRQAAEPERKAGWDALRGVRVWVLEPHDARWHALQHLLAFWQMDCRRYKSGGELLRVLANIQPEKQPDLLFLSFRADETDDHSIQDLLGLQLEQPLPVACVVNSVDSKLHRQLKDAGAWAVLPRCSERAMLYRSCCALLNHDTGRETTSRPLANQSILVAENNTASRHFLKVLLSTLGADATLVEDGLAAIHQWQKTPTRFVLLDMNMPRMNGLEATRILRSHDGEQETVIIGMSACLSAEEEQRWLAAGLDATLPKPFDEAQLMRCLQPWLRREKQEAPDTSKPRLAQQLLDDPTLLAMIMEELPKQMSDLDDAFIAAELDRTRAAAHHLHGTAAFFHLEPLKSRAHTLEKRLKDIRCIEGHSWLRDDMASVSAAVRDLIEALKHRAQNSET